MNIQAEKHLDIFRLKYKAGDLILREGDYGISIYKIIKGKIKIFTEKEDLEIPLATAGPGEIIGEMIFLNKSSERRTASARAVDDCELEVWHPDLLSQEYESMSPILKYLADQALNRLIRINKLFVQLTAKSKDRKKLLNKDDPWAAKRRYYRKEVTLHLECRPMGAGRGFNLSGEIKDLSLGGAGLEIWPKNLSKLPFKKGDEFVVNSILPNGRPLDFNAQIRSIRKGRSAGSVFVGASFSGLTDQVLKDLGFFLIPS